MSGPLAIALAPSAVLVAAMTIGAETADAVPLIISPALPATLFFFSAGASSWELPFFFLLRFTESSPDATASAAALAPSPQYWPISPPLGRVASARASSAACSFAALTPARLAWSYAACSLTGSALPNRPGMAALSCFSASFLSTATGAGSLASSVAAWSAACTIALELASTWSS